MADYADTSDLSYAIVPTGPVLSMLPVSADVSAPVGAGYVRGAPSVVITSPFSLEERLLASSGAHALVGDSYGGTAVKGTGGAELLTDVGIPSKGAGWSFSPFST